MAFNKPPEQMDEYVAHLAVAHPGGNVHIPKTRRVRVTAGLHTFPHMLQGHRKDSLSSNRNLCCFFAPFNEVNKMMTAIIMSN